MGERLTQKDLELQVQHKVVQNATLFQIPVYKKEPKKYVSSPLHFMIMHYFI